MPKETKKKSVKTDWSKVTVKDFPYSDEQYEKRIVFGKLLYCISSQTKVTVFTRDYFTDRVVNNCAVEKVSVKELQNKKYSWMAKVKLAFIGTQADGTLTVTLIRKHEKNTSEEFFEKMKTRKKTE